MKNSNVENYISSKLYQTSEFELAYLKIRKPLLTSIFINSLFFLTFILNNKFNITGQLFEPTLDYISLYSTLSPFLILSSVLFVFILSKLSVKELFNPDIFVIFVAFSIVTAIPIISIIMAVLLYFLNFEVKKLSVEQIKKIKPLKEQQELFLDIVNNKDNCLTLLLHKKFLTNQEKIIIDDVLQFKIKNIGAVDIVKQTLIRNDFK